MNILFDINHPAHVHLLRHTYDMLVGHGHQVLVVVKEIPSAMKLLDLFGIPYLNIGKKDDAIAKKGLDQLVYDRRILKLVHQYHIEVGVGSSINLAHVSRISRMKSIILDDDDDEAEPLFVKFGHPFADVILSPGCIQRKAKKTIGVRSYHELAYLHPNRFTPDPNVLKEAGIAEGEPFFIMRFNAFKAHHDVGAAGLSIENKRRLLDCLKSKGRVLITTERDIDEEFRPYQLSVSPEKAHSLMYYATLFVGDSQTMTSEAAVLGTPAVKCNSFAGRLSVPNEIESKYGLCYSFLPEQSEAFFDKIESLLSMPNLKMEWQRRRQLMLADKIDYAGFLAWFVEYFPRSREVVKETPDYQSEFK